MYKEATKTKLRFETPYGLLTTEQLWDLPLNELDKLAVSLEENYENSKGKSFLEKKTKKDKTTKLKFDIVLDILNTKVEEQEKAKKEAEDKEQEQKILQIIKEKEDDELKNKEIDELKKMINKKK